MKKLNYQEIELLNERTKSKFMKEYYNIKEEISNYSLSKIKNFKLAKEITALLEYNSSDTELIKTKKIVLGYCLEDIKKEKQLINRLEELEKSNLFKQKQEKKEEKVYECQAINEVKSEINNITKYVLKIQNNQ